MCILHIKWMLDTLVWRITQYHYILSYSYKIYCNCIPVQSMYGGYYGLVVVTPPPRPQRPHPQTLHRSHDNLKNPYWIASIFYMYIDIGERMPGKQDGPSRIIYGPPSPPPPPPPPPNSPKCAFFTLGPIYEKLVIIFSLVIHLSALLWGLSALKFSFTWVWRKAPPPPPGPPQIWKKSIIFSYFGFKLNPYPAWLLTETMP